MNLLKYAGPGLFEQETIKTHRNQTSKFCAQIALLHRVIQAVNCIIKTRPVKWLPNQDWVRSVLLLLAVDNN